MFICINSEKDIKSGVYLLNSVRPVRQYGTDMKALWPMNAYGWEKENKIWFTSNDLHKYEFINKGRRCPSGAVTKGEGTRPPWAWSFVSFVSFFLSFVPFFNDFWSFFLDLFLIPEKVILFLQWLCRDGKKILTPKSAKIFVGNPQVFCCF